MVFKTICVGSIPATLVILVYNYDKHLVKTKLQPSSHYLWSLKKKNSLFRKKQSWFLINQYKRKVDSKFLKSSFFQTKLFKNSKTPRNTIIFFQPLNLINKINITPKTILNYTLFSSGLSNKILLLSNTTQYSILSNSSYHYFNQFLTYKLKSIALPLSTTKFRSNKTGLIFTSKVTLKPTLYSLILNFIKQQFLFTHFFKNVKYQLQKNNFFLETFFLSNYEFKTHKLLRLDSYSRYYFLKDFFVTAKKQTEHKTLHFYSKLLVNDNCFEFFSFPVKKLSKVNFKKLKHQKVKKKNSKLLKGFASIKHLPSIQTYFLNLLKQKLLHRASYSYKLPKTPLVYKLSNKLTPIFHPTLLLNFNFTKLTNFSSILVKYLLTKKVRLTYFSISTISILLENFFFSNRLNFFKKTNLVSVKHFNFILQKKILKIINFDKFRPNIILWYYTTIIRFIEFYSGKKVFFKLNPFIENALTFTDLARCNLWFSRIQSFQRMLGPKIFIKDSLKVLHLAFRFKDVTFLSNWIRTMLQRMNFWSYKLLFRYLKYLIRNLFYPYFVDLKLKGIKLKLKGKISVAGNARTRKLLYSIGNTSHSTYNNRISYDLSFINTFTGVLGFQLWFFF